jgi:hypothetical protein
MVNFEKPVRPVPFKFVQGKPAALRMNYAMTNVSGLGGQSVTIVTKTEGAK